MSDQTTEIIRRFGLKDADLADERVRRLVNYKVKLDAQIEQIYRARVMRIAKAAGFSDNEFDAFASNPRLGAGRGIARSICQSLDHLTQLRAKKPAHTKKAPKEN